jgi:beta-N-acetylhexosaminidase
MANSTGDDERRRGASEPGADDARATSPQAPVILDVAGKSLTPADCRRLAHPLTGGVILFTRNGSDRRQITQLVAEMKSIRPDLLVCVDHEGGRVQRFRTDGFTPLPAMRRLGERWSSDGRGPEGLGAMAAIEAATAAGYVMASELRACGIDLSFAPVLDLDHGRSRVVGDRAFHRDPRVVTVLARSLVLGMRTAGMAHCGKHFPGHGWAEADSHVSLPVDSRPLGDILVDDARPYEWMSTVLAGVMPGHVVYRQVDDRPAGYSRRWLREILRERLGFTGAIFSDDLSMEGGRRLDGRVLHYPEAAIAALQAGCDVVLLCNQSLGGGEPVDQLLDGLEDARANGRWTPDAVSDQRRIDLLPQTEPIAWDDLMLEPRYRHALDCLA